jgi:hypothetical protein
VVLDVILDRFRHHGVDLESAVVSVLGVGAREEPVPFRVEFGCDLNSLLVDAQHAGVEVEVFRRE